MYVEIHATPSECIGTMFASVYGGHQLKQDSLQAFTDLNLAARCNDAVLQTSLNSACVNVQSANLSGVLKATTESICSAYAPLETVYNKLCPLRE